MSLCQKLVTDEEIFPTKYGEYLSPAAVLLPSAAGMESVTPTILHGQRKLLIFVSTTRKL